MPLFNPLGFNPPGSGAIAPRSVQSRLRETISLLDYETPAQALSYARSIGAIVTLPSGVTTTTGLTLDFTGITGEPAQDPLGVELQGYGTRNTILNGSVAGQYALTILGGVGVACHTYNKISDLSISRTTLGANGLKLYNICFGKYADMTLQSLNVALDLESTISTVFDNLIIANNVIGVAASRGSGFSDPNANYFTGCKFRLNSSVAYVGGPHSGIYFDAVNVEGNGTVGNANSGGLDLTFLGTFGSQGLSINGGYFEGNMGGFDIRLTNLGSKRITHTIKGVCFNRIDVANFVTNNVVSVGKNIIHFDSCSFEGLNNYVPNASRQYVSGDADTVFIFTNCVFASPIESVGLFNQEDKVRVGKMDVNGNAIRLPPNWVCINTTTGVYTVTHNMNNSNYVVEAISNDTAGGRFVQRSVNLGANSFQIITTDFGNTLTNCPIDFTVTMY